MDQPVLVAGWVAPHGGSDKAIGLVPGQLPVLEASPRFPEMTSMILDFLLSIHSPIRGGERGQD